MASVPPLHPGALLAALGDEGRLRVLGAVALGAADVDAVVAATGSPAKAVRGAVARLVAAGALVDEGGLRVASDAFVLAAAAVGRMRPSPSATALGATEAQAAVLDAYLGDDGRLASLPVARAKRAVALDLAAQRFEPGATYPEKEVNEVLRELHDDVAHLRRLLVDEGLLERRDGFYWRAGGTFDVG